MAAIVVLNSSSVPPPPPLNPDEISINEKESVTSITMETGDNKERKRVPKRILHFSDGILEEFSDDDVDEVDADVNRNVLAQALVDTTTLTWGPYLWYNMARAGSKTLAACDFLGEHLASFFGITSPKYQFEVDDYFRQKAEEEKERQQHEMEVKNWTSDTAVQEATVAVQPNSSSEWKRVNV